MDNLGNSLRFSRGECAPLCTIMAGYRRARPNVLTEADETRLAAAHHIATAVMFTDQFGEGAIDIVYRATGADHSTVATPGPTAQEIIIDNAENTVGAAIEWAAEQLVPGSPTVDRLTASEGLLLAGGAAAGLWAMQLSGNA